MFVSSTIEKQLAADTTGLLFDISIFFGLWPVAGRSSTISCQEIIKDAVVLMGPRRHYWYTVTIDELPIAMQQSEAKRRLILQRLGPGIQVIVVPEDS